MNNSRRGTLAQVPRPGLSQLGLQFGLGTRVLSPAGYLVARYFRSFIALFIVLILWFSLAPYWPHALVLTPIGLYVMYFILRQVVFSRREKRFYHPWVQFARAQLSILGILVLSLILARQGIRNELWLLYIPSLLIISRHNPTWTYVASVLECCAFLLVLEGQWNAVGVEAGALQLTGVPPWLIARSLGLVLVAFILHYLMRLFDTRESLVQMAQAAERLMGSCDVRGQHLDVDCQAAFQEFMSILRALRCGIIAYDSSAQRLITLGEFQNAQYALDPEDKTLRKETYSIEHPMGEVVRSRRPQVLQSNHYPFARHWGFAERFRQEPVVPCPLPRDTFQRLAVPVLDPGVQEAKVLGILYFDFAQRAAPPAYQLHSYFEGIQAIADRLVPVLRQHRAQCDLERQLSISNQMTINPALDVVLDFALDAVVDKLGFEFALVSLVDLDRRVIRGARGRNIPLGWIEMVVHSLDSHDIQADIVRSGKQEVLRGWDPRFHPEIWERYEHSRMIRVFTPIVGQGPAGERLVVGTIEAGYRDASRRTIEPEQCHMLSILAQRMFAPIYHAQLLERAQHREESLRTLQEWGTALALVRRHQKEAIDAVGNALLDRLGADLVILYRYTRRTHKLYFQGIYGEIKGNRDALNPPSPDHGIIAHIMSTKQSYYQSDVASDPLLVSSIRPAAGAHAGSYHTFSERQGIVSFAGLPMCTEGDGNIVGVLCANYRQLKIFTEEDKLALELAARFGAVALHNAGLIELAEEEIRDRERRDLALRLHDTLSSTLPAIRNFSEAARDHLAQGNHGKVIELLRRLEREVLQAQREIDLVVFSYRAGPHSGGDLREGMRQITEEAQGRFGLRISLEVQLLTGQSVSVSITETLLRVYREAVANIVEHANTRDVEVHVVGATDHITMRIKDNGCGFDPHEAHSRYSGLNMIREQVEQRGGCFRVDSHPGQGTTLAVEIPLSS
ncbi:MAG: GAF domain-containing protein [Anaerolineae bacterium]